jgi:hypothetical protein
MKRGRRGRYSPLGEVRFATPRSGSNLLRLSRTASGRSIGPGVYRISIAALDEAGNRSAPRTLSFTVRR